jgi:hypothetical protein
MPHPRRRTNQIVRWPILKRPGMQLLLKTTASLASEEIKCIR